jgi:hypothetical protein
MDSSTPENDAPELSLDTLLRGFAHIPPEGGALLAQAALVCLDHEGHTSGVRLLVDGAYMATCTLTWTEGLTEAKRRFWNDLAEATQHGATGVALLLIRSLTGYTVIERARKGTGFDWWLGTEDNLFQGKARLEISGILRGTRRRLESRIKARLGQTRQSDALALPAFVVVVEFGMPRAKVGQR